VLGKPESEVSVYVFGTVGVSIAVGSILAGVISRGGIQPRLIPVGAVGIMVCSLLLALAPSSYVVIHRADAAKAEQGLAGFPATATVSYSLKRARDRISELKPKVDLQNDESSLKARLQKVKDGDVDAMIIPSASLGAFETKLVKAKTIEGEKTTAEYHQLLPAPADANATGLIATPVEVRRGDYLRVLAYLFFVGMFAGMYVIPLQALIQKLSPVDSRGQYIAASNALDAVWNLTGIGSFFLLRNLGVQSQDIFFLTAFLAAVTAGMFFWKILAHIDDPEWR